MLGDVKAGFPSPAEDIREKLDLIKLLVKHKASTFFFRVSGVSMVDAALDEGGVQKEDNRKGCLLFFVSSSGEKRVEFLIRDYFAVQVHVEIPYSLHKKVAELELDRILIKKLSKLFGY